MAEEVPEEWSFSQVPIEFLMQHHDGHKCTGDAFVTFLRAHTDELDAMATALLRKLHKDTTVFPSEKDELTTTLERGLGGLRGFYSTMARAHSRYAMRVQEEIRKPLEKLVLGQYTQHNRIKSEWNRIGKTYRTTRDRLTRAKKGLEKTMQDWQAACDMMASAADRRSTALNEVEKLKGRMLKAEQVRAQAEEVVKSLKAELHRNLQERDNFIRDASRAYQQQEEERIRGYQEVMVRLGRAEREHLQSRLAELDQFEATVAQVTPQSDMRALIKAHRDPDRSSTHMYFRAMYILDWDWNRQQRQRRKSRSSPNPLGGDECFNKAIEAVLGPLLPDAAADRRGGGGGATAEGGELVQGNSCDDDGDGGPVLEESQLAAIPFTELIEQEAGRAYFLQMLNERRGGYSDVGSSYDELVRCLKAFLDKCQEKNDVRSAQQTMVMCNTFFRSTAGGGGEADTSASTTPTTTPAGFDNTQKQYLLEQVKKHGIWKSRKFWEDALMMGVADQFDLCPQSERWEDLNHEALQETVIRVHNTIFGQLGSLGFNMAECGLPPGEIRDFITSMCQRTQLGEDQTHALLQSVRPSSPPEKPPAPSPIPPPPPPPPPPPTEEPTDSQPTS